MAHILHNLNFINSSRNIYTVPIIEPLYTMEIEENEETKINSMATPVDTENNNKIIMIDESSVEDVIIPFILNEGIEINLCIRCKHICACICCFIIASGFITLFYTPLFNKYNNFD
jgi:hypothetical protein